jgi:hypothetical protein
MDHSTRLLAGYPHCNVRQCDCGALHVTIGPVTLRLEPAAAETLRSVLAGALSQLGDDAATGEPAGCRPRLRLASPRGGDLPS